MSHDSVFPNIACTHGFMSGTINRGDRGVHARAGCFFDFSPSALVAAESDLSIPDRRGRRPTTPPPAGAVAPPRPSLLAPGRGMDDDWHLAAPTPPAKKQPTVGTASTTTPVTVGAAAARRAPASSRCQQSDFPFTRVSDYTLDMFEEHVQRCKTEDCVICYAAQRLDTSPNFWSSIQLDPDSSDRGSWAAFSTDGGTPRFGCWVCYRSDITQKQGYPAFSASTCGALHVSNLKKHVQGAAHKALAAKCLAVIAHGKLPEGLPVPGAPPASDFRKLFLAIQGGTHALDVGGRKKQRRLLWCLAESFRAIQRKFFRGNHVSTILQDSTEDRLLMRIKGCNASLDVRSGIVGVADLTMKPFNARATGIKDAALSLLKQFATPLRSPPYSQKTGKLDAKSRALRASPPNRPLSYSSSSSSLLSPHLPLLPPPPPSRSEQRMA